MRACYWVMKDMHLVPVLPDGVGALFFFDDLFLFFLRGDTSFCESIGCEGLTAAGKHCDELSEVTAKDGDTEPEPCEGWTDGVLSDRQHDAVKPSAREFVATTESSTGSSCWTVSSVGDSCSTTMSATLASNCSWVTAAHGVAASITPSLLLLLDSSTDTGSSSSRLDRSTWTKATSTYLFTCVLVLAFLWRKKIIQGSLHAIRKWV